MTPVYHVRCISRPVASNRPKTKDKGIADMCLAIPSQIVKIENRMATIDVDGVQATASLLLLEDVKVGDHVIVHAGFAIHKIDEKEARQSLKILKEAAALVEQEEPDG